MLEAGPPPSQAQCKVWDLALCLTSKAFCGSPAKPCPALWPPSTLVPWGTGSRHQSSHRLCPLPTSREISSEILPSASPRLEKAESLSPPLSDVSRVHSPQKPARTVSWSVDLALKAARHGASIPTGDQSTSFHPQCSLRGAFGTEQCHSTLPPVTF